MTNSGIHRAWIAAALFAGILLLSLTACGDLTLNAPQIRKFHRHEALDGTRQLMVDAGVAVGTFRVEHGGTSQLFSLDLEWDAANQEQEVLFEPGQYGRLRMDISGRTSADDLHTNLLLTDQVPLELQMTSGVGETTLDLTHLQVESIRLKHGVGRLILLVDEQQSTICDRFEASCGVGEMILNGLANLAPYQFEFSGGVGRARLVFSGENQRDMKAGIEVGIGEVAIVLNEDLGVRLRTSGGLTSSLSLPSGRFEKNGQYFTTGNYERAKQRLDLAIKTGLGAVEITFQ
ncbi:MAG: hypothetical protein JXQ27_17020 [Acidobacteria bacterium]|nr:hypothetical protein [Acidobacteriota bacterium]